jgi:TonB family protein
MNEMFTALLQSSACIAIIYLAYSLFLRKETFYTANRTFLLAALLISAVIPFINLPELFTQYEESSTIMLEPLIIGGTYVRATISSNPATFDAIMAVYLSGLTFFGLRFLFRLFQIFRLVKRFGVTRKDGAYFVHTDRAYAPFSFFNLIFINATGFNSSEARDIMAHEQVHARQWHSLDLILLEILAVIHWFNPFIWMLRHAFRGLHEFLADEGVIHSGADIKIYSAMLFRQSTGIQVSDLTNHFSKSLLKRRFTMMYKKKSKSLAGIKLILAIPLVSGMMLLIACTGNDHSQQAENPIPPGTPETVINETVPEELPPVVPQEEETPVFTVVDEMPVYPGGLDAMYAFLGENIKYPEEAKKNGTTGRVFISFVVEKDGSISNIEILRGIGHGCDEEAIRVVESMPPWTPGKQRGQAVRVRFNLPIKFALD